MDTRRKFDAEDLGQLVSLGRFAASAYQAVQSLNALTRQSLKLDASELRYRRLFTSAKDGILILDANTGKIIEANLFMADLLCRTTDELLGKELFEIGLFRDIQASKAAFDELQRGGYLRYEHLPMQNRRGETVPVELVSNVYPDGDWLVAQCNVRDISERTRMQDQIKLQAEALANESLRKDEFLAMLSHELRNPLAAICSAVQLLRMQESDGEHPIQQQARERSQGGLGIGLTLVQRIVQLHGGTVAVHSPPPGREIGTEFILEVPRVPAPLQVDALRASVPSRIEEPNNGRRVLLVDDNRDECIPLGHILRKKGFAVQSAHTGPEGLRVAQQWRPDIVLLDIGLPEMDGYEVARRLRATPSLRGFNMTLIAMTGYAQENDIEQAREAGFDAHVVKPYQFEELEKLMALGTGASPAPLSQVSSRTRPTY